VIAECAYAKVNLILRVGPRRGDLHELCSLFASIDLHDVVEVEEAASDSVECAGVDGPNLASAAVAALRERIDLPPLRVRIDKRIPVAAGLGGGSADAAAVLRAGNRLAGSPLTSDELRATAARLGSDVPSQVEPRHAIVAGTGERVEPVELPPLDLVLVPSEQGLSTAAVYAEADRLGTPRDDLRCDDVRALAAAPASSSSAVRLAARLENDLEPASLSLRPELAATLAAVRAEGALGAAVSGSGPTVFGVFAARADAERAAGRIPGAVIVAAR